MFSARIRFRAREKLSDEILEVAQELALSIWKNGQALDKPTAYFEDSYLDLVFQTPTQSALEKENHSIYCVGFFKNLLELTGSPEEIVVGTEFPTNAHIESLSGLGDVLVLDPMSNSPLRNGSGEGVPLFLLPAGDDSRERIWWWLRGATLLQKIEAHGTLEFEAYREIASPFSELNRHGQEWARQLADLLERQVYYVLNRFWGHPEESLEERVCPSCGHPWTSGPTLLTEYPNCCERCRLVTTVPFTRDSDYRATIGTWSSAPPLSQL